MRPQIRTLTEKKEPSIARAAIVFGVVLTGSLVAGVLLSRHEKPVASVVPDASETARTSDAASTDGETAWASSAPARTRSADDTFEESGDGTETAGGVTESDPEQTNAEIVSGPVSWESAEAAYVAGDFEQAARLFARYTSDHPGNPWGHYMQGLALRRVDRLADAEAALLACLAIDPDHAKALVNLARVRLDGGRAEEAEEAVRRAATANPESVDARRVLARALHTQDLRDEALEEYDAALAIDPTDAWSLNNSGLVLIEQQRFAEAAEKLTAACNADATQAVFHNNLGVALERTGRFADAERAYAAALAIDAGYEKAAVSLARVEGMPNDVGPAAAALAESGETPGDAAGAEAESGVAFIEVPEDGDGAAVEIGLVTADAVTDAAESAPAGSRVAPADPRAEDRP